VRNRSRFDIVVECLRVTQPDGARLIFFSGPRGQRAGADRQAPRAHAAMAIARLRLGRASGGCYRSLAFRDACRTLGLRHICTPRTNGKAERFIQTALRNWAYARAYLNSDDRKADLPIWLHRHNWHRPHGSLKAKTIVSRGVV
jgi:transposase InsO family protein